MRDVGAGWNEDPNVACHRPTEIKAERACAEVKRSERWICICNIKGISPVACSEKNAKH